MRRTDGPTVWAGCDGTSRRAGAMIFFFSLPFVWGGDEGIDKSDDHMARDRMKEEVTDLGTPSVDDIEY